MRKHGWLVWAGSTLLVGGAAIFAWCGWVWYQASLAQKHAREWLEQRPAMHAPVTPSVPAVSRFHARRGDVIGNLTIPRLHLSVMVLEGDDARILKVAAGHIPGTAFQPGAGNIAIAAHRDTFFRPLRSIRRGDLVTFQTPAGVSRFAVSSTEVVRPTDVQVLNNAPGRDLTLVTCYPFSYLGSAPRRFIVFARRLS